jgi:phosphatidylserine decarboxylase
MTPLDSFRKTLAPMHPEGARFVVGAAIVTALLFWLSEPLGWLGVVITLFIAYFFRNPERVVPQRPGLIVSPADGLVESIGPAVPPAELEMGPAERLRVSIFLSVLDVHINRVPADGTVLKAVYRPGKFFNAALDKASEENERMAVKLDMGGGTVIAFVQIAGLIARRILCDLTEGQTVLAGERFGLIRFGSRLDVYLPDGVSPAVAIGQRAIGGETILADIRSNAGPLEGEVR